MCEPKIGRVEGMDVHQAAKKSVKKPWVIVLGNEKGGTGKSTVAMHLIVSLLKSGAKVGSIDVDARQGTLSRYIENRKTYILQSQEELGLPTHTAVHRSVLESVKEANLEENARFLEVMASYQDCDYVIVDTPGSDSYLSRLAHSYANTLITPLNDSFIDLDMLVRVSPDSLNILRPSTYSEMVWEQKKQKALRENGSIDWIVLRNRLSSLYSHNKEEVGRVLGALGKRVGYRLLDGFSERVVFRELFVNGLTLLDLKKTKTPLTLSHVAAKQELSELMQLIQLPLSLSDQESRDQEIA